MQAEEQRASWSRIAAPARILYVRDLQRLAEPPWNHLRFTPIRPVGVFGLLESWESLVSCSRISLMPPIYPFQRGNPPSHWKDWDVGRLASGVIVPVSGGFWTLSELPAGGFSHWLEESTVEGKKKPRWRENHRGEKGERRRKGSIVGNCCGFLVGSFADISYINRRC